MILAMDKEEGSYFDDFIFKMYGLDGQIKDLMTGLLSSPAALTE